MEGTFVIGNVPWKGIVGTQFHPLPFPVYSISSWLWELLLSHEVPLCYVIHSNALYIRSWTETYRTISQDNCASFLVNCSVIMHVNTEIWLFPETAPSFPQTFIAAGPLSTGLLHTNWFVGFCAFSTMVLGIGWCSLCSLALSTQCYLWIYNSWKALRCYDFDKSHILSVVYDQNSCLGFLFSTRCIRH